MNKQYIELFKEVSNMASILAEQVMDFDKANNDDQGYSTASVMRDDYAELYDKLRDDAFDIKTLTKNDYIKLLAAAMIVASNIEDRITIQQKAVTGYRTILMPKLDQLITDGKELEGDAFNALVEECFKDEEV